MGGAGVCFDDCLVGVITRAHPREGWFQVIPVSELLKDGSFRETLKRELGDIPGIDVLRPPVAAVSTAIKDVSKADPANIQEVAAAQFGLSNLYYENVLAQARRSFNAAVAAAVVGLLFFLGAVAFAMGTHQLVAPVTSLVGGGVIEVVAALNFWLYGRTAIQLNSFHLRLERMQRFLLANSVSASLTGDRRESTLVQLIGVISGAPESGGTRSP
jgi:hypothetical protein